MMGQYGAAKTAAAGAVVGVLWWFVTGAVWQFVPIGLAAATVYLVVKVSRAANNVTGGDK